MSEQKFETKKKEESELSVDRAYLSLEVLPKVQQTFAAVVGKIEDALKNGNIVLDANVLLIPYGAGGQSLAEITETYRKFSGGERLFVPAQAMREFLKHRPTKLAELYQGILDKLSTLNIPEKLNYPILNKIEHFSELNKCIDEIEAIKKRMHGFRAGLLEDIRRWEWGDPVIMSYRDVILHKNIFEPDLDKAILLQELERRYRLKIPPGYKDFAKEDYGIGDYLIWKTILSLGEKHKRDTVFVSGDEKADWQHRAGKVGLLPRYELLDEYRIASGGHSFFIVPLSTLLELSDAALESIKEIRQEEARIVEANSISAICPYCDTSLDWRLDEHIGSSAMPTCPTCARKFHVHRTRHGITIHKTGTKSSDEQQVEEITVNCPSCEEPSKLILAVRVGSSAWKKCENCEKIFEAVRGLDLKPFVESGHSIFD